MPFPGARTRQERFSGGRWGVALPASLDTSWVERRGSFHFVRIPDSIWDGEDTKLRTVLVITRPNFQGFFYAGIWRQPGATFTVESHTARSLIEIGGVILAPTPVPPASAWDIANTEYPWVLREVGQVV